MHAAPHREGTFLVPMKGQGPEVGFWPQSVEPLENEVAELVASYLPLWPGDHRKQSMFLVSLCQQLIAKLQDRAAQDIDDGVLGKDEPRSKQQPANVQPEWKMTAARLGRVLDWVCKGRSVIDMGPRIFAVASHIRAGAIDHRTDQQAALEIGNGSRASVARIRSEFRRDLGADYPGENGESKETKRKCKNSRTRQLKN